MKLIHLSDLHLGMRVSEVSLIEDQRYILEEILKVIDIEQPDGVIIAGDVYDKSIPSTEAVELFDEFLVKLAAKRLQVYIISGNHDSPERLAFAGSLIDMSGVHLSPVYKGNITPLSFNDEFGRVNIYMLPFVKPVHVKHYLNDEEKEKIVTYTDAIGRVISDMNVDTSERNVLIAHQFVTGAVLSESEDITVGGLDNVEAYVFAPFDYTALGHIHKPQDILGKGGEIRYCGTPLKYSFSEAGQEKSVTVVELMQKGSVNIRTIPLNPKRDMVEIKGTYEQLVSRSYYEKLNNKNDFYRITLTDENDIPEAVARLRTVYPNILKLDYENTRTSSRTDYVETVSDSESKTPLELFSEFFKQQNGSDMTEEQTALISQLLEEIEAN
ncbi:MAG: exonuclease SbcCD subunit D [Oscillospiraceae bacterium]|nr:exonuclease SbcCD subunit D [Oscillospiraceae bacterium]